MCSVIHWGVGPEINKPWSRGGAYILSHMVGQNSVFIK